MLSLVVNVCTVEYELIKLGVFISMTCQELLDEE